MVVAGSAWPRDASMTSTLAIVSWETFAARARDLSVRIGSPDFWITFSLPPAAVVLTGREQVDDRLNERDLHGLAVLALGRRDGPDLRIEIDFIPSHRLHVGAPAAVIRRPRRGVLRS